jgi:hypothetical protein
MSTSDEREQALMAAVREERQVARESAIALPSTEGLYRGHPFYKSDLTLDAVLWVSSAALPPLRRVKRAAPVVDYLQHLADEVTVGYAMTCALGVQSLLKGGINPPAEVYLGDVLARTALYAWCLGHPDAAALVIEHASRLALSASSSRLRSVRYWQTCMAAVLSLTGPDPMGPRDHGHDMRRAVGRLIEVGANSVSVIKADKAAEAEEKAGMLNPFESRLAQISRLVDRAELDAGKALAGTDDIEPAGLDDVDAFMLEPAVKRPPASTGPCVVVIRDLSHLPDTKLDRGAPRAEFSPIENVPLPLAKMPDLAEASAALRREFPWLSDVIDRLLTTLAGRDAVRLPPSLLLGRAGCGKTLLARRIAEVLHLEYTVYPAGGVQDSAIAGTNRMWSSARASLPTQLCLRTRSASPCIIVDEVDKAATSRKNGALHDALLPMLGEGKGAFHDPYIEAAADLSGVNWLFTANERQPLRGPLLDRLVVLDCPDPTAEDTDAIVAGIMRQARKESGLDPRFTPDLDHVEMDVLRRGWRGGSIRPLVRAVNRLLALRSAPGLAH